MASKTDLPRSPTGNNPANSSSPSGNGGVSKAQPVLIDNSMPGGAAVNRKKQKRRQKQAARHANSHDVLSSHDLLDNPQLSNGNHEDLDDIPDPPAAAPIPATASNNPSLDQQLDYRGGGLYAHPDAQHLSLETSTSQSSKKKKKNKTSATQDPSISTAGDPALLDNMNNNNSSNNNLPLPTRKAKTGSLWDTDGPEERSRIKEFWLHLTESERRDLVNIEKGHVLQKMKEQQKHSCSCTVCGRKRTAIEEELESLLKDPRIWADPTTNPPSDRLPSSLSSSAPSRHHMHEFPEDADEDYPEDDPVDYSDEYDEDDDFSDDIPSNVASEFFQFGNSLTVKDGILTVADDLLKNDGQKFIDMMEKLAERRMRREEDARYGSTHGYHTHGSLSPHDPANHLGEPPLEDDEYEDEEDDYDDEDGELDYDDEEDEEMDALTEDQRMEEGRRMFQIFAARMFEQRVVTAYREKVAYERQQALINEQEQDAVGASEAKKSKNAEKKKRQRQAAKEAKAAKEAAKEEEKQRKEAATRAAEEKKKEEQRLKQEEARKKKDAERKAQEEKKRQKEAETQKRQDADRERQLEQERRNREAKAEEKRRREETEHKKREEKETREREAKEKRAQEEAEKKEQEDKARAEREALERKTSEMQTATVSESSNVDTSLAERSFAVDAARRPSAVSSAAAVAVPPNLKSRNSQTSHESPSTKIATPALPKAPTPSRPRDTPGQRTSTPHTPERTPQSKQSTSPKSVVPQSIHPPGIPTTRQLPFPPTNTTHTSAVHHAAPSAGSTSYQQQQQQQQQQQLLGHPAGNMSSFGMNGYPNAPGMVQRMPQTQQSTTYPGRGGPASVATQSRAATQGTTQGSGLRGPTARSMFPEFTPANFTQPLATNMSTGMQPSYNASHRDTAPSGAQHTRHLSNQLENLSLDTQSTGHSAATQPIGRPAQFKRPASVNKSDNSRSSDRPKSSSKNAEVDDLSNHLGSSALLDDTDEPLPSSVPENRRPSAAPGSLRSSSSAIGSPFDYVTSPFASAGRAPGDSWARTPAANYGAPGGILPPSHNPTSASVWGNLDVNSPSHSGATSAGGWGASSALPSNAGAFGMQPHHRSAGGNPRAITVRMFIVQACKSLSSQSSGVENSGFFDFSDVVRHTVESGRQMHVEPGIQLSEIRNILDTEGDSNNGGGTFLVRLADPKGSMNSRTLVRWVPDHTPIDAYSRQSAFYHQQPPHQQAPQAGNMQGAFGGSAPGSTPGGGQNQGLGLGEIGSPMSETRLPNLGGLGRF